MKKIRFCQKCEKYSLKETCQICDSDTIINAPQKYSRDEEIAKYRRQIKKELLIKRGIL
jgi:H/ACA ribonucleoprotein complex subunit 3